MRDTAARAVAIVGVGAVMPDAADAPTFWNNIKSGRYSVSEVPAERWNAQLYFDADPAAPDKTYSTIGGWALRWTWDPLAWKLPVPPRVSASMDRGQKWAVITAREALGDFGYPERPLDPERTAVIIGTALGGDRSVFSAARLLFPEVAEELRRSPTFAQLAPQQQRAILEEGLSGYRRRMPDVTEDAMPGELANIVAGRVAALFNFRGPNYIVDAACASATAAISTAIEGLVQGDYDAVLTGGVDANMSPSSFIKFCKVGALSATGTRPFAAGADGFVMGEGAAAFLLKRLADAERDGDRVYAVIRGVGGSSDGRGKGITAPNPIGQKLAVRRAWEHAGLSPASLTLMEAHGTSTRVGDATEVASLNEVFGSLGLPIGGIALGSVKSNIGHLKGAAGAAGLLKAVLALHDKVLPPSLGFDQPNPNIDFARSPFRVNAELRPWELPAAGVRRAAVSSFGFGGTNFHAVLEEHQPGRLTPGNRRSVSVSGSWGEGGSTAAAAPVAGSGGAVAATVSPAKVPLRGALVLGAATASALAERLQQVCAAAQAGRVPPPAAPALAELRAPERVAIDYGDAAELASKSAKALKALANDQLGTWKALRAQGIFRGRGAPPKVAFLYTGQGSQYVNMLQLLRRQETVVAEVFAEADRVMGPLLGRPLSDYIFVDGADSAEVARAEEDLRQTAITQPAVLAADEALTRLLASYGIAPDMVMGHSLGEYGALVAAGALPFGEALEAVSARGREMTRVAMGESGAMAAVFAPLAEIERIVAGIEGYVVVANHNSRSQAVVGGTVAAVQRAVAAFEAAGFRAVPLTVSHAFHTKLVAPASAPLAEVLRRLHLQPPRLPLVANLSGQFYPTGPDAVPQMVEILGQQVAAPVQFIQGLRTLHAAGARLFVEIGPKKALHGFVEDVLGDEPEVSALFTNHPRQGDVVSFNQALCGLYAAGLGRAHEEAGLPAGSASSSAAAGGGYQRLGELAAEFIERGIEVFGGRRLDGRRAEDESVVITGAALGLPGGGRIFDPTNVERILRGDQLIDTLPLRLRREILAKNIVRLVKSEAGAHFEPIAQLSEVVKLAGRGGTLDLTAEFGYPADRLPALDIVTRLAIAAGLDALHDAGLPLVQHYKTTTRGTQLPAGWRLPAALRDDTGVIFASSFPGYDALVADLKHYYTDRSRRERLAELESLLARASAADPLLRTELERRIDALRGELEREGYQFDRRFVLKVLPMGHSQLADLIGARGPNTHVNAACASTTHALSVAEDWLRRGRCRRVLVVSGDDVTSDHMMEWFGSGFLASGAAATDELVEEAAVPFDRRRHGLILGMGASAIVLETASAARERGVRPICELLGSLTANSAFHATRLDVDHICGLMEQLIGDAERQWRIDRRELARRLLFVSHETYTPARGGSAQAEVEALRRTFGADAEQILVANTKGLTGHAMGVGIEDVVAIKALETGVVPPVPNYRDPDPELGALNLSRGGAYDVGYALRLGAGFGSQISLALLRWFPPADGRRPAPNALGYATRVDDRAQWEAWLARISGQAAPELELVQRTLRIKDHLRPTPKDQGPAAASAPSPLPTAAIAPPRHGVTAASTAAVPVVAAPVAPVAVREPVAVRGVAATVAAAPPVLGSAGFAAPPPSGSVAAVPAPDRVLAQVLQLVAESTGYAPDMLDPDLDLEADLGIDTVKQAETFAQVRERYAIPRDEGLRLRDFPTLRHVTQFVYDHRPDLRVAQLRVAAASVPPVVATAPAASGAAPTTPVASAPTTPVVPAPTAAPAALAADAVLAQITALVAESTGYAADMLDPDLDLEADLGIDTVKQAETFAQVRERYTIPRDEGLRLRDFPTLRHVTQFVYDHRPDLRVAQRGVPAPAAPAAVPTAPAAPLAPAPTPVVPAVGVVASAPAAAPSAPAADAVLGQITALVAESTGYAADMLDPDLDLEADLGIDTVKQAETFAQVRERYAIPRDEGLRLRDFPTLRHVTQFVYDHRPDLRVARSTPTVAPVAGAALPGAPAPVVGDEAKAAPTLLQASPEAMDAVPRRLPVPQLRPALECCKPTGVTLDARSRVIVMLDRGGVGAALVARLEQLGVAVLAIDDAPQSTALLARLAAFGAAGPVQGIYWLPALDVEGDFTALTPAAFREALRWRVKLLHATARALYDQLARAETFLVAATRLGGLHGYEPAGPLAALGGAVSGFVKALKRERAQALVKCVDFARDDDAARAAALLLDETQRDAGVVEVGYHEGLRWTLGLSDVPLALPSGPALPLAPAEERPVFVVTGAAGSIVAAIVADLARAWPGVFYLLDRVPEPTADDPDLQRFRADREALKRELFARRKAQGERVTPAQIEKELAGLERAAAAQAASAAVQAAGGEVRYRRLDLLDATAVAQVLDEVRREHGRIDVLLHAAGVEISHFLPDKEPAEFDLVFDVKAEGWFNLLHAARGLPLGTTVVFSSIAGRFGNGGQTDYSAANDLLCKTSAALPRLWPGTRTISIDWTAWGGLGMAARGSIPKLMERAGIDMLAPEAGIGIVRRELQAEGLGATEVLVAGRLGLLLEELDATGGLDPLAQPAGVSGPMLTRATAMPLHGGLAAEVALDPGEQPFLFDHRIDGTALLPGVMGIEAFAEAARWALPSWQVVAVEQVAFAAPFKFYRGEPRTVTVNAQLQRDGEYLVAQCHLVGVRQLSGQQEPQASTHFSGRVRLGRERPSALQAEPPRLSGHPRVLAAEIYRVYFHGPAYQVLEAAWRDGEVVYGLLPAQLPQHHRPETLATVMAPRLIELCFQTAGVYELGVLGRMGLPAQVDRVDTLRDPATAEGRLCAVVRPNPAGSATFGAPSFDAYVTDEAGKVFVTLRGYRTVALPGGVSESARAPLRSAIG